MYREGKNMWDNLVNVPLGIDRKLNLFNSDTVLWVIMTFISPAHWTDEGFQVEGKLHVCAALHAGLELRRHWADEDNPGIIQNKSYSSGFWMSCLILLGKITSVHCWGRRVSRCGTLCSSLLTVQGAGLSKKKIKIVFRHARVSSTYPCLSVRP